MTRVFAAVDIGASGGRVMAGLVDDHGVRLQPIHRFANGTIKRDGHLRWDIEALFDEVLVGLKELARRHPDVESIGIDTWAVDYALLDDQRRLLAHPIAYRDDRTARVVDDVHHKIDPAELYRINGLQFLPFNTLYQLAAEQGSALWRKAAHVVLLPDLLAFWLTGLLGSEYTNATTTGLVDARSAEWSEVLFERLGIPTSLLPPIQQPGVVRGVLDDRWPAILGMRPDVEVIAVGSHDTASAVVGIPALNSNFAFVSSGTWSLVGLELAAPILTEDARSANFTNEGGVDRRTRFLRNVGGLWLLQESIRTWASQGRPHDIGALVEAASALPAGGPVFDVDDPAFIPPGDMPARIKGVLGARNERPPEDAVAMTRCIVDSLAAGHDRTIRQASQLAGRSVEIVHIVGGGANNALLCQRTADLTGLQVVAGPVEATAIGNICVQARTRQALRQNLDDIRQIIASDASLRTFHPTTNEAR